MSTFDDLVMAPEKYLYQQVPGQGSELNLNPAMDQVLNPAYLQYLQQQASALQGGSSRINAGEPISRAFLESLINPNPQNFVDGEGNQISPTQNDTALAVSAYELLALLDQHGANSTAELPEQVRAQLPNQGIFVNNSPKTFGTQFRDFVTNPAFLTAAGGIYGVYAGGAGAAAGAGEAAAGSGGAVAASDAAMAAGAAGGAAGTAGGGLTAFEAAGGLAGTGGLGSSALSGSSGGMQPGVGEYGELGTGGWEGDIPGGPGVLSSGGLTLQQLMQAYSAANGGGGSGGLGESLLNASPALFAAYIANQQRNDIDPMLGQMSALYSRYAGNEPAYLKSLTDPYDMATGQRRSSMLQDQGLRGVSGSSFGQQAINNFDYMSGVGRANILGQGINQSAETQRNILGQQVNAVNNRNLASNALIGAGLGASGSMFQNSARNQQQRNPLNDVFAIGQLFGATNSPMFSPSDDPFNLGTLSYLNSVA